MKPATLALGALAALGLCLPAPAQEIVLRLHHFLPAQATAPANAIAPWVQSVEEASGGRIAIQTYPAMQLGGAPDALFSQAQDGVVDIVWTVLGYTPGRFPKSEVFELPFLATDGEHSSGAFYDYAMDNAADEFASVHVIALHTHGPGLFHTRQPITALEDIAGMKIRGGSRIISNMLAQLGAEPVGMPAPQTTEALSRGVIDGTTLPWEVTPSLRIAELVHNHTGFSGEHGLYTQTFAFVMNRAALDGLPDDLRRVIETHSGRQISQAFGRAMDEGDAAGLAVAQEAGNTIITLDADETARWKQAAEATIDQWFADMAAIGIDGEALYGSALEHMAEGR